MELLVLSTLKCRMRAVTPFTFMDYFFRKNNDDLPPPSSQISRLVELILRLTRVVSISVIRETNLDKSTKDHVSHEDESKTSKDSVESSENDVQVLVPEFDGKSDVDAFIEWLNKVERVLNYKKYGDPKQVTIVES
ncbi:hypothetical protein GIB67_029873 [Kingdonia uniflora]|uniref:Uncharacterized protein n=1 Tax=Kingdonia uniflora TaxID=39325 RepID=A0A7J7NJ76_9MAGN|nr:hypothetical protein GIB67_029873 [Kingdonia uniflora]